MLLCPSCHDRRSLCANLHDHQNGTCEKCRSAPAEIVCRLPEDFTRRAQITMYRGVFPVRYPGGP